MGKSTTSCFKIVTCGSDSVDSDDLQNHESKGLSDKRWSFRKKSARQRVLSNTVISEAASSVNKESPEAAAVSSKVEHNLATPEGKESPEPTAVSCKVEHNLTTQEGTSVLTDEKNELSTQVSPKLSDTISTREDNTGVNVIPDESTVIVIQAAIRRFLAERELLKNKKIIMLQATVRGRLVRKHAVGTLQCIRAIVKLQALVRARHSRSLVEGSGALEKQNEKCGNERSKKEDKPHPTHVYISLEKLLRNQFTQQLLESTPRTKPSDIKCDPSKSDSTWKWLERWTSLSSVSSEGQEQQESGISMEQHEKENLAHFQDQQESGISMEQHEKENLAHSDSKRETLAGSEWNSENDFKSNVVESAKKSKNEENLISCNADNIDQHTSPSLRQKLETPLTESIDESDSEYSTKDFVRVQMKESDLKPKVELNSVPVKSETETEQVLPHAEKLNTEKSDTDTKRLPLGLRKASNPSFIAAQSKFEELSLAAKPTKVSGSSHQDAGVEPCADKISSVAGYREVGLADNSVYQSSVVQVGGSECGTELSITSTLDSPARSEVEAVEPELGRTISNETANPRSNKNLRVEAIDEPSILGTELSYGNSDQLERYYSVNSVDDQKTLDMDPRELERYDSVNSVDDQKKLDMDPSELARYDSINTVDDEKKPDSDPGNMGQELESRSIHPVYKSSPEASSLRSHITVPESQSTPTTTVSKPKKTRGEKSESSQKRRSSDKRSPSNPTKASGANSSLEQTSKDHKTGKRRNSLGSAKLDHVDQEPRDSSSSNPLPSYMQATESARAKAIANISPRSSPDVQDKDTFIKKRHSLPGANGRQGSPCIQRSGSQTLQNAKASETQSPQDRKWRR